MKLTYDNFMRRLEQMLKNKKPYDKCPAAKNFQSKYGVPIFDSDKPMLVGMEESDFCRLCNDIFDIRENKIHCPFLYYGNKKAITIAKSKVKKWKETLSLKGGKNEFRRKNKNC